MRECKGFFRFRSSANIRLGLPGNLVYSVDKSAVDDGRRKDVRFFVVSV